MSNRSKIIILFLLLSLAVIFFVVVLYVYKDYIKKKNRYSIFISGKNRVHLNQQYVVYHMLAQFPFTKRQILKIRKRFDILTPGDDRKAIQNTIKVISIIGLIALTAIIWIILAKPGIYGAAVFLTIMYVVENEIVYYIVERKEVRLLGQLDKFIGDVRHYYFEYAMVDEALNDAIEHLDSKKEYEISLHGKKIYDVLVSENQEEEIDQYNEHIPNRFLRTFLANCVLTTIFDDKVVEGQSVFLTNLKDLKREIMIEKLKREKINNIFLGVTILSIAPILFLKVIENWAINMVNELKAYYQGAYGIVMMVLLFAISLLVYTLLKHMKEVNTEERQNKEYILLEKLEGIPFVKKSLDGVLNRNYGKTLRMQESLKRIGESIKVRQFLLKRLLYSVGIFLLGVVFLLGLHYKQRNMDLYYVDNVINLSSAATPEQVKELQRLVRDFTFKYKDSKATISEIADEMFQESIIHNKQLMTLTAEEVIKRVHHYQNQYFKWYELIGIMVASILTYWLPYWMVIYKKKQLQIHMEDEVIQFQSVILMLIHIDRITIETVLEWMDNFAVIFKESIDECLNNFSAGDMDALEQLKSAEPYEAFVRIIENLERADDIGIESAFNEIAVDRLNYQEKRKQDNEIHLSNQKSYIGIIALIPLVAVIGLYLIVPLTVESLTQLVSYSHEIEVMQ